MIRTLDRTSTPGERARWLRAPHLGGSGLDLLDASYVTHSFAPHVHEGYVVGVIERGVEAFRARGVRWSAGVGEVVVINPGEVHTGSAGVPEGWRYRTLYPDAELLLAVARDLEPAAAQPFFPRPVLRDADLAARVRSLHRSVRAGDRLEQDGALLELLALLIARHTDAPSRPARAPGGEDVRAVLERLRSEPERDHALADLAADVGLSPWQLTRAFRAHVGLPPHAYRTALRVERARRLLARGVPPAEAAVAVGFFDQSHLGRHFRRHLGVTPGQYAAAAGGVR